MRRMYAVDDCCVVDDEGSGKMYLWYSATHAKVCKPKWRSAKGKMVCYTWVTDGELCGKVKELFSDWKLMGVVNE
jgi:hypothetical protein